MITETRRAMTAFVVVMLMLAVPGKLQSRQEASQVSDVSVGFPFSIISETQSTVGPSTWFINIRLSEDYYSRKNLEIIWRYFCSRHADQTWKLDLRVYVDKKNQAPKESIPNRPGSDSQGGFAANLLRQGDGALAGGGDNEILIYHPDLDKPDEVERIVLKGKDPFDPYAYTGNRDSDFVAAAAKGDKKTFESLLAQGVNVDARDRFQGTALIVAATSGFIDLVRILLEKGASVDAQDEGGWTALISAASQGHIEILKLLLEKGAGLNKKTRLGMSALSRAIYDRKIDTVRFLIARGAEIEFKDQLGDTPLILAAQMTPEVVPNLLERGAAVDAQNNLGETPLMRAQNGAVIALLAKGANINAQDFDGNTALIHAIRNHRDEKVRLLISGGADLTLKNKKGATALRIAELYTNQSEVLRMLKEAGAK